MRILLAGVAAVCAVAAVTAGLFFGVGQAADPNKAEPPTADSGASPNRLIVHEWGTFTSFSGSDGVPARFTPNNTDLPSFVYTPAGAVEGKGALLAHDGLVSMETPIIYFYTDQPTRAAQAELQAAEQELVKMGRFAEQARLMAEKRLDTRAVQK